jgi:type IV secretory pathway TraG/TraD family ATPase VirD4
VNGPESAPFAGDALIRPEKFIVSILEGMSVHQGPPGSLRLDGELLSTHVLFLGGIGSGKTNAMKHLIRQLRDKRGPNDAFVIFDTKGDFLRNFYRPGDAVLSSNPEEDSGGVIWNLFRDLPSEPVNAGEEIYEIASTIFSDELDQAGENIFFAAAARDIFAAVVEAMTREPAPADKPLSNGLLRQRLESSPAELNEMLRDHPDLAGTARYLEGGDSVEAIMAFLQLTLRKSFTGVFRRTGDFSVREFMHGKGGRALFIEYDIANGANLLPIYRVLMDMAIKEALGLGRRRLRETRAAPDNYYFVLDEFALLPKLPHMSDGINFGRELGLKFLVATQNVSQVLRGYGAEAGESILSGFGTVFAFRLMDDASRSLVQQRFGTNRKQVSTYAAVRHQGVQQTVVTGNVIEDWETAGLGRGKCIASLPQGPPFFFEFRRF